MVEWTVRMVMLVLAGLVTLAILGSIAAMSNDAGNPAPAAPAGRPVLGPAPQPTPGPQPRPMPAQPARPAEATPPPAGTGQGAAAGPSDMAEAAPQAAPDRERERWLEAIAYGLLALAGLAAIGLVLLWRATRQLGRIADAVEARQRA